MDDTDAGNALTRAAAEPSRLAGDGACPRPGIATGGGSIRGLEVCQRAIMDGLLVHSIHLSEMPGKKLNGGEF
jgi:hypothetical protein